MPRTKSNILLAAIWLVLSSSGCDTGGPKPGQEIAPGVKLLGRISDPRIVESSGVIASRRHPKVLWTHNDGGGEKQALYAIDRDGSTSAVFPVIGAEFRDWEDIAIDDAGHLYLADIGNNEARRDRLAVHEIDEPNMEAGTRPSRVSEKRTWHLKFPGAPFDCESLFIWKDYGYVISKVFGGAPAQVFRFPLADTKEPLTLELVATTTIRSPVTGADISADGELLGIVAKDGAYVFRIKGDVARVRRAMPHYTMFKNEHVEGCCFVPDGLLATSEGREVLLFTSPAFIGK